MQFLNRTLIFLIIFLSTISLITTAAAADPKFINNDNLITALELKQLLDEKKDNIKIIDVRSSFKYLLGHLPEAVNMIETDFANPDGWVESLIAKPTAFAAVAQKKGINNNSEIVVYDNNNGIWAARLWWVFKVYDHHNIKILEGGYEGWKNKGFKTKMLPIKNKKGDFIVTNVTNDWIVNSDTIAENIDNDNFIVLDTRSEAEFQAKKTNYTAARQGTIPNSIHLEWKEFINDDYAFKSAAEIRKLCQKKAVTKDKETIALLSHTGVRAAHTFFSLKLLGYENIKVYDAGWLGWSNRSDLPVE